MVKSGDDNMTEYEKDSVDDSKAVFEDGESSVDEYDENLKSVGSKECFECEILYDDVCIDFVADDEILVIDSKPLDGVEADDKILLDDGFDSDDVNIDIEEGESSVDEFDENEKNDDFIQCFDSEILFDVIDDACVDLEAGIENLIFDSEPLDSVEGDDETLFDHGFDLDDVNIDIEDGICSVDKDDFCLDVRAGNESSVSVSDALDSADDNMGDSCDVFSNDEAEDDNSFVENEGCNSSEQDDLDCFRSFLELDKVWTFERKCCNSSEQEDLDWFSSFLELDKVLTFERELDKSEYLGCDCTVQCTLVKVDVPKLF